MEPQPPRRAFLGSWRRSGPYSFPTSTRGLSGERGSWEFYKQMIKTKFLMTPKTSATSSVSLLNGLSQKHLQKLKSSRRVSPGLKCNNCKYERWAFRKFYVGKLWYKQLDHREFSFLSTCDDFLYSVRKKINHVIDKEHNRNTAEGSVVGAEEDSWESLGLQGDQTSQS